MSELRGSVHCTNLIVCKMGEVRLRMEGCGRGSHSDIGIQLCQSTETSLGSACMKSEKETERVPATGYAKLEVQLSVAVHRAVPKLNPIPTIIVKTVTKHLHRQMCACVCVCGPISARLDITFSEEELRA